VGRESKRRIRRRWERKEREESAWWERDVPSRRVFESSDVYRVDDLDATTHGTVVERDLLVKAVGRKLPVAVGLFSGGDGPVPVSLGEPAGDGSGDGALLGVELTCATCDAMGEVAVHLRRDRFHGSKGPGGDPAGGSCVGE
jgi:hypothetical protein